MRKCWTCASLPDAQLAVDLLAHSGIDARVFNANAQGGVGEIPFTHAWPEVWILDDRDFERARRLLSEREHAPIVAPVRCGACGEENPGNFEVCWSCGAAICG